MIKAKDLKISPLNEAFTIPSHWYYDEKVFKIEKKQVFLKSWHLLGSEKIVKNCGDSVIKEVFNQPIIITRQKDNTIKAFYNVCKHRAGPLLNKSKKIKFFQCKYHGWTYHIDGRLKSIREFKDVKNFNYKDYNLKSLNIRVWQGLIFINFKRHKDNFNLILSEISNQIKPIDFSSYTFHKTVSYDIKCNWKTYIDNFLEGYHIPFVHPKLNKLIDYKSYKTELFKNYSLQSAPIDPTLSPYDKSKETGNTAFYYTIFPNILLNIAPGRLQTNVIEPKSANSCTVYFDYYFEKNDQSLIESDTSFSDEIQLEDIEICERVQKGLESQGYEQGRISPQSEQGLYHFQSILKEKLENG